MEATADLLVVGLGALGSAVVYQAAKRGARVIGIDRFDPPHEFGSTHGESRITRAAIGEDRDLAPLVQRSNRIWAELEVASGASLSMRCGALVLSSRAVLDHAPETAEFWYETLASAEKYKIPHELLDTREISTRFPQFRLRGDELGYYEPGAGLLRPERCVEVQLAAARAYAAEIHTGEKVLTIRDQGSSVLVASARTTYSARRVIVAAGPWISALLDEGRELSVPAAGQTTGHYKVFQQALYWFEVTANAASFSPRHFPVYIWNSFTSGPKSFYGFPLLDGALKVATEQFQVTHDPDGGVSEATPAMIAEMYEKYVRPGFHGVGPRCLRSRTCYYTVTPDGRFVVGPFRDSPRITMVSACSGHGFKHSAGLGEALAQHALGEEPWFDLDRFSPARLSH